MAFTTIMENILTNIFGSVTVGCIFIMILFVILFVLIGINFRFSILATMPLAMAFTEMGWFGGSLSWIAGMYWIFIVGFSLYTIWTLLQQEYF